MGRRKDFEQDVLGSYLAVVVMICAGSYGDDYIQSWNDVDLVASITGCEMSNDTAIANGLPF